MATKVTIVDLFPGDEGMTLAKDVSDGSPRHITEIADPSASAAAGG
ncbi:hypothetical protein [Ensifer aridi]|nr:hypothetical protein [Ensifer aridi]